MNLLKPGIYMHDLVDKTYQIPYPSVGTDMLLPRLEYIHEIEKTRCHHPKFLMLNISIYQTGAQIKDDGNSHVSAYKQTI